MLATLSAGGYRLPFIAAAVMVAAGLAVVLKRPAAVPIENEVELVGC